MTEPRSQSDIGIIGEITPRVPTTVLHCECLAVFWSVLLDPSYLEGSWLNLCTDHDALRWILKLTDSTGKLERWKLRLSEFAFDVVHSAGIRHQAAEASSRLKTSGIDTTPIEDGIAVLCITASMFPKNDW